MNLILFDQNRQNLLPFTYTRPIAEFRCGILTLAEKWSTRLKEATVSYLTEDYLSAKYSTKFDALNYYVNGSILANNNLVEALKSLKEGELLVDAATNKALVYCTSDQLDFKNFTPSETQKVVFQESYLSIENIWDIFAKNGTAIEEDYQLLTEGRTSQALDETCTHIGNRLFIE